MQVARRRTAGGAGVADGLALRDPLPRASGEPGQVTVGRHHATVADGDLVAVTSAVVRPLHRPAAAARIGVPQYALKSVPSCSLYTPVTGCTRIPYGDVM